MNSRTNWAAIAHTLASRLVYQAEACEHAGEGAEACCLDWRAYRAFVDAGGTDFGARFRQVGSRPISVFDVIGRGGEQTFVDPSEVAESGDTNP